MRHFHKRFKALEGSPRLRQLAEPMLGHGQKGQAGRKISVDLIGLRQRRQGVLEITQAELGRSQSEEIEAPVRHEPAGSVRLQKRETVLEGVEVRPGGDTPASLIITLR